MIAFPHAKINLGLYIISRRPDGYHNLETVFYPLPLCDILEIVPAEETRFLSSGLNIPGKPADNLVLRAIQLLKRSYPRIGALDIYLHKSIPMGAGLGGGSSDAACTLQSVNRFFNLNISATHLNAYALELGSDCPFFLQSTPCYASGRGEILEPVGLDLSAYSFLLVHPEIHIETAGAFAGIRPAKPAQDLKKSIMMPVPDWKKNIHNIFEIPVFEAHPSLRKIRDQLYAAGALYAAMTGSGSTIYGIFEKFNIPEIHIEKAKQTYIR